MRPLHPGLPIGSDLPDFCLPNTDGVFFPKDHLMGSPAILIIFMDNNSPLVIHSREVLMKIIWEYQQKGVATVAIFTNKFISSSDNDLLVMKKMVKVFGYTFPYLYDQTHKISSAFQVYTVPDFYVFDSKGKLAYHGQMDSSRPDNDYPVTGKDLRSALNSLLARQVPSVYLNESL